MRKVKVLQEGLDQISSVEWEDLSRFEEKMTKIKYLKKVRRDLDKSFLITAIEELELQDKKISARRVKRICKKVLAQMIEEVK